MNPRKAILLVAFVFSLCFINACRTTESQLQSLPPEVLARVRQMDQTVNIPATPTPRPRVHWFLLTTAILAGAVMVFISDRPEEKKSATKRRSSRSKKRKK